MERQLIDSDHFRKLASIDFADDEELEQYVTAVMHGELLHAEQPEPTHESAYG